MYNLIKFYKDKITTYIYQDIHLDWIETNIDIIGEPLSDYFNHLVEFSEDLTVKDFVLLLSKYSTDLDKHFSAYNHGNSFEIYSNEVLKKEQPDYFKECDEIEIAWETDVQKEEGINFIVDWVTFFGRIKNFKPQHQLDVPTRGMQLNPLRDWKNLPLRLNKTIFYSASPFESKKSILKGVKHFSLFDVISGFLYELTCHGTPEQQINMANEVRSQIKEISDGLFDAQISFIPIDATMLNSLDIFDFPKQKEESIEELNKKMNQFVEEEEFEKAQEIKSKIDSLKKKKN